MIKKLFKYTLFLLPLLFPILVHADTTIDTANWINVTGIKYSETGLQYTGNPTFNNDWLLNNYLVSSGTYVNNGADWNYVEFSYFEHSGGTFNPCNSTSKFTANFSLLFTSSYLVDQVVQVKWGNDNCAMTSRNNQSGLIELACGASPTNGSQTDIFIYYSDSIFQQNQGYVYISRDIDISCGLNTDALINNDNANTQNIINNNNQNTQSLIDSSSSNADRIIEENKKNFQVCNQKEFGSFSGITMSLSNGSRMYKLSNNVSSVTFDVTKYRGKTINLFFDLTNSNSPRTNYCIAQLPASNNKNYCLGSNFSSTSSTSGSYEITIPSNAHYLYAYGYVSSGKTDVIEQIWIENPECVNILEESQKTQKEIQQSLNDDDTSGASSEASDFFSSFNTETFGLTSIITAPLTLIQSVLSSTCTDLQLPLPFLNNKKLILPCMTSIYTQYFGTFFTIYQSITYGIIAYWVCVRIFNQVKDFKNPEHDEIEVMDL